MKLISNIIFILGIIVLGVMIVMALITQHISQRDLVSICFLAVFSYQIYRRKTQSNTKEAQQPSQLPAIHKVITIGFYSVIPFMAIFYGITMHIEQRDVDQCNDITQADLSLHACTNLINKGVSEPVVFMKRAVAYINKDMPDQSLEDLNRSLGINPNYWESLSLRGTVYLIRGQYSEALHDLDQAVHFKIGKSDNLTTNLIFERGMAKFYAISPASAIDDLANAIQQDSTNGLGVIWLHLARVRTGQDDQQEFKHNSAPFLADKWPAPLIALYHDKGTAEEVFVKAKADDIATQLDHMCDANFYIAELYLLRNMKSEAQPLFQAAKDTCPRNAAERSFAQTELTASDSKKQ